MLKNVHSRYYGDMRETETRERGEADLHQTGINRMQGSDMQIEPQPAPTGSHTTVKPGGPIAQTRSRQHPAGQEQGPYQGFPQFRAQHSVQSESGIQLSCI